MKPFAESLLSGAIAEALANVATAKADLAICVEAAQSHCEHRIVSEMPYKSGVFPAERICNHCRMIEVGSHWSGGTMTWSRENYEPAVMGNVDGRIVVAVSRDEFFKMRVNL